MKSAVAQSDGWHRRSDGGWLTEAFTRTTTKIRQGYLPKYGYTFRVGRLY
jgi:hypothetical protein